MTLHIKIVLSLFFVNKLAIMTSQGDKMYFCIALKCQTKSVKACLMATCSKRSTSDMYLCVIVQKHEMFKTSFVVAFLSNLI